MFTRGWRKFAPEIKAPRIGLKSHHGFVEIGAFVTKQLRQTRSIEIHAWTSPKAIKEAKSKPKPKRDPLRLAHYYQSLFDTGKFESRAALAWHLGVSRERVPQVLNRLKDIDQRKTKSARLLKCHPGVTTALENLNNRLRRVI